MPKPEDVVLAVVVLCQGDGAHVECEFTILPENVLADDLAHIVEGIRVIRRPHRRVCRKVDVLGLERNRHLRIDIEPLSE